MFGGACDRRHFMTAMSTPSTKSRPILLALISETGEPCLNPPCQRSENTGYGLPTTEGHLPKSEGDHFHRQSAPSGARLNARQTNDHSIPIAPGRSVQRILSVAPADRFRQSAGTWSAGTTDRMLFIIVTRLFPLGSTSG